MLQTIKICSYNVRSGGFVDYTSESQEPENLSKLQDALRYINADIVLLVDTFRWDKEGEQGLSRYDLVRWFGYPYYYCINLEAPRLIIKGVNNGITMLTRIPNVRFSVITVGDRKAIKATIGDTDIYGVYLDYADEEYRFVEAKTLLEQISPDRKSILIGDFNMVAPGDNGLRDTALHTFLSLLPKNNPLFAIAKEKFVNQRAYAYITDNGFCDADYHGEPTIPTKLFHPLVPPLFRVDYAFFRNCTVSGFTVLKGSVFDLASDHYPIVFEIQA